MNFIPNVISIMERPETTTPETATPETIAPETATPETATSNVMTRTNISRTRLGTLAIVCDSTGEVRMALTKGNYVYNASLRLSHNTKDPAWLESFDKNRVSPSAITWYTNHSPEMVIKSAIAFVDGLMTIPYKVYGCIGDELVHVRWNCTTDEGQPIQQWFSLPGFERYYVYSESESKLPQYDSWAPYPTLQEFVWPMDVKPLRPHNITKWQSVVDITFLITELLTTLNAAVARQHEILSSWKDPELDYWVPCVLPPNGPIIPKRTFVQSEKNQKRLFAWLCVLQQISIEKNEESVKN